MTLSITWVRSVGNTTELVMASDSRLRFGCAWDCGPKIFTLPRTDSAICFAGETCDAYPLMIQMQNAVSCFEKLRSRALDLHHFKGHVLRIFNHMREQIHDLPKGQNEPDPAHAMFILGGYSWERSDFAIWILHFDRSIGRFTFRPSRAWKGVRGKKMIALAGDHTDVAKEEILSRLKDKQKLTRGGFDMEPFEVLRDMIRSNKYPEIGGAPQIVKIYRHMNCKPYAVYWPSREFETVTLFGRPLLDYEKQEYLVLDSDTLQTENMKDFEHPA